MGRNKWGGRSHSKRRHVLTGEKEFAFSPSSRPLKRIPFCSRLFLASSTGLLWVIIKSDHYHINQIPVINRSIVHSLFPTDIKSSLSHHRMMHFERPRSSDPVGFHWIEQVPPSSQVCEKCSEDGVLLSGSKLSRKSFLAVRT